MLFMFLITSGLAYSQIPLKTALKAQVYSSTGSSPTFIVNAIVGDDLSAFDATNVSMGQYLYVIDGSFCYELLIDSIIFQSGTLLEMQVIDLDSTLSNIPLGQGAIVETYPNFNLPTYVSSLRDDLRSCVLQRLVARIDAIVGAGIGQSNTASNLGSGVGLFASKLDSDLQFKSIATIGNTTVTSNSTTVTIGALYYYYKDDAAAAAAGVPVGQLYKVDTGNPYGLSWGALKSRNE